MVKYVAIAFFLSFFLNILIITFSKKIKMLATDHLHNGPQTFHTVPTPRTGGFAIFIGVSIALLAAYLRGKPFSHNFAYLILISLPVFLAGFLEDLTARLNPKIRILLLTFSASLAYLLINNISIIRLDIPFIDKFIQLPAFSFLFTIFALVGSSNAINIIDGFNGLASMVAMTIFMALAYVAYELGDYEIATICVVSTFALLGFFLLNYPFGLIFLGDGGAYFTGFLIGVCSILLVKKHSEVSAWFALLVNIYPVYETIFSIYRRKILRKHFAMKPDGIHLHSVFYRIFIKKLLGVNKAEYRNPITSVFLWVLNAFGVVPALIFWNNTKILILCTLIFAVLYTYLYWSILKLKMPSVNSNSIGQIR